MGDLAIRVDGLGKRYRIGLARKRRDTLRDALTEGIGAIWKRGRQEPNGDDTFWALKDVSFDVKGGEVVGVIGRNGAGKSTLLKILSRITRPTAGYAEIHGRVGSLLEVGTGFHPELTGRENVYLNGAILGMKRAEIERRFDEIVAFAEIEKFLETPVKRYSSGMYVRLAFAVAAHLEPDILLVDEVLAVGDIDFQKKCLRSMGTIANNGRTVLIVSHNLAMVKSLCGSAVLLTNGTVKLHGSAAHVIDSYLAASNSQVLGSLFDRPRHNRDSAAIFSAIEVLGPSGIATQEIGSGEAFSVKLHIVADRTIRRPWIGIRIRTAFDQLVFHAANREAGYELQPISGVCAVSCTFERTNLLPGRYFVDIILTDMLNTAHDELSDAIFFDIRPVDVWETGFPMGPGHGVVFIPNHWCQE